MTICKAGYKSAYDYYGGKQSSLNIVNKALSKNISIEIYRLNY